MNSPAPFRSIALSAAVLCAAGSAVADPRLVMVEQPGCIYCQRWDAEIAPAYPNTDEGQFAPLLRADLRSGPPEGITYARRVVFTPTFILIENGAELGRIEGYPGEDFFWPLLGEMLGEHTDFEPAPAQGGK
ncbi:thioredoxin family protein [Marivita sp. GX14005]|uniref:thioredoxin family protein n=1 Tax=Marivita sp. GX14005 TaxID=2942276 RepID=UPI00201941A2|nr:thioredoxin family protein [Marivita sp. GX14005]MCL3880827.1 thioredoxin family protein [Marivita sp. GX14005]